MSLWLIRAGSHGEYESKFLKENRVYVTWLNLAHDLQKLENRDDLIAILETLDPGGELKKRTNRDIASVNSANRVFPELNLCAGFALSFDIRSEW